MKNLTKLNRRRWAVQLALTTGLALLFIAALLWGLRGLPPAYADPGTLYVDGATGSDTGTCGTMGTPCKTISYTLNSRAGNGDEIRVAVGTYMETLDIQITVTLKGGYTISGTAWLPRTGETIVDANGADNQVITIYPGTNVTVEGFTVQGANHTSDVGGGFAINGATVVISDTVVRNNSAQSGGGVYAEGDTNVSLINSTFTANAADSGGDSASGLAADVLGHVVIQNTVFTENTGAFVLNFESGQPFEITGGQVVSNTVSGFAVIRLFSGSGTISGTAILSNTSGAIATGPSSSVSAHSLIVRNNEGGIANGGVLTITDSIIENNSGNAGAAVTSEDFSETNRLVMDGCTIRGNSTPGAVGIATGYAEIRNTKIVDHVVTDPIVTIGATVELVNVLLADNETAISPIVFGSDTGTTTMMNVTVAGNVSDNPPVFTHGVMTLTNTIVWGNTTSADMLGGPGTLLVNYSDIEDGWTGTGNLDADPRFVDAANGDYHLGVGSPCTDKGTPVGAPTHDIEGTSRDAAPDMGAYEWTGFRIFLPLTLKNFGP